MRVADGDEDEELVPRQRTLMGMKFHDEESRATAWRVSIASVTLGVLVVIHFFVHLGKKGNLAHSVGHLFLGLMLPLVGYRSATLDYEARWRPRLLWMFHIGNVLFVLVHAVVLMVVVVQVAELESASVESMCNWTTKDDPWLRPAEQRGPEVMPTLPPEMDNYAECAAAVQEQKGHAPQLMVIWTLISLPYWACAAYAAYYSHELYLHLRVGELTVRREAAQETSDGGRLATVAWGEAAVE